MRCIIRAFGFGANIRQHNFVSFLICIKPAAHRAWPDSDHGRSDARAHGRGVGWRGAQTYNSPRSGGHHVNHFNEALFRNQVLESLVNSEPLGQTLDTLLRGMERLRLGALCSVLLLDADGRAFAQSLAPSLPAAYSAAMVGVEIGPGVGSCGTAAFTGQRVVVQDIATDPLWEPYRALAASAGVAACWSQPIVSSHGHVLGTFAIYYRTPRSPDDADLELIQQSAALACIAIEKEAEAHKLRDSEERYRTLVEWSPDPILVHRMGHIVYVNPAAVRAFGAQHAEQLLGKQTASLVHPDFRQQQTARMHAIAARQPVQPMVESRFVRMDGSAFDVEVQGTPITYLGKPAIHVAMRDITQRKRASERLKLAATVFSHAREGIVLTGADARILEANETFCTMSGTSRTQLLGTLPVVFQRGAHNEAYFDTMWQALKTLGHWSGEIQCTKQSGSTHTELITISVVQDDMGAVQNYVMLFTDITPLKTYQQQLESLAHFDALTHLPNRLMMADRLQQAMSQAQRREQSLAVVFLDLDGFKAINDHYGHDVGDQLLIVVSQRMKAALRLGDTLARIGGDEFVAVLVDLGQPEDAEPVLSRLLQAAADPVHIGNTVLHVSASMGIAAFPRDGTHTDLLLRRADQSMYQAKEAGRNRFCFYKEEPDNSIAT